MAFEKGLYQQEGLDVTYRLFPSGTTAFQAFQTGQGDIVMTGDLPSVQYFFRVKGDYRTIAVIERDAKGYVAVARKDITKPQDLVGKTVATRVGSTGSWFISEYLTKNGVDPTKVTVKNLDTQVLPAALCGGEIAAFFIWQPVGSRTLEICPDKAHYLTDATGYIQGYLVAGARPEWLASPQGKDIATRWLRATMKGPRRRRKGLRRRRRLCQGQARPERESHARAVGHQHAPARARQDLLRRLLQPQPLGAERRR